MKKNFSIADVVISIILAAAALLVIIPFVNVLCLSLEPSYIAEETGRIHLIPKELSFEAYAYVMRNKSILTSALNSVVITLLGSLGGAMVTAMLGYGLTFKRIWGHKVISFMVLFTMMFSGGIIPLYILVQRLGLLNHRLSLVLPFMVSAYNTILMKNFFESIPESLSESAQLDGATEFTLFFKIILPLSKPIIATIILFYAVSRWNDYFYGMMFITDADLKPLQVLLRELLLQASADGTGGDTVTLGKNMKMAIAIVTMVPIMIVYPFLQKYFTKGVMLGSVKG